MVGPSLRHFLTGHSEHLKPWHGFGLTSPNLINAGCNVYYCLRGEVMVIAVVDPSKASDYSRQGRFKKGGFVYLKIF